VVARASVDLALYQGARAARRGAERHSNPYHCATTRSAEKWHAWFAGYDRYKTGEFEPRVQQSK
jgi:hypothetical protein